MRVPHVSERVKEAPAQALRGVFAGIGQLLLVTDKLRNKAPAADDAPSARIPDAAEPESPAASAEAEAAPVQAQAPPPVPEPAERDLNKTGNVRLLTAEDTEVEQTAAMPEPEPEAEATAEVEATSDPEAEVTAEAALPLANYDELSVNSLRARLRNLTAAQVTQLAEYEKAHAARPEVVTMFERRIAKLEADG